MSGALILCGTPIGNLEDMSPRAVTALAEADVIACEDTRRTRKLLSHFGVRARELVVYKDVGEPRRARELVDRIARGETVVLVSDAGMPGLSDPGYRVVRECVIRELDVKVIPGPSAVVAALAISGLPPGRFVFEGFLPRRASDRRRRVAELASEPRTIVIFESPHRIGPCLQDLMDGLGNRPTALARELTKLFEEVVRGPLAELIDYVAENPPRGEITLVVQGAIHEAKERVEPSELARRVAGLMDAGVDRKEAMAQVARAAGVPKREVFDALVRTREEKGG